MARGNAGFRKRADTSCPLGFGYRIPALLSAVPPPTIGIENDECARSTVSSVPGARPERELAIARHDHHREPLARGHELVVGLQIEREIVELARHELFARALRVVVPALRERFVVLDVGPSAIDEPVWLCDPARAESYGSITSQTLRFAAGALDATRSVTRGVPEMCTVSVKIGVA